MANYRTVEDIRLDALFRAGEPASSTSTLYDKALEYANRVQQTLLLGGSVAVGRDLATSAGIYAHVVDLPITDWWWARKRGVLTTEARLQRTLAAGIAEGATSVTFTAPVNRNLLGFYMKVPGKSTIMKFLDTAVGATTLPMDAPWPELDFGDASTVDLFKLDYDLPTDFLRFATPLFVHAFTGRPLTVSTSEQRDMESILQSQSPVGDAPGAAYMLGPRRIGFDRYDTRGYRVEYDYVFKTPDLVTGGTIALPEHQRAVLAVGAAMLLAFDKSDDRAENLASEYRELVQRMVQEHRRGLSGGSWTYGVHRTRLGKSRGGRARIQPRGEQFLV